jgi:hypothetical protein
MVIGSVSSLEDHRPYGTSERALHQAEQQSQPIHETEVLFFF